jgi:hypothetical protein
MMIHLFAQDMTREGKIRPCYLLMTRELTLKWMDLLPPLRSALPHHCSLSLLFSPIRSILQSTLTPSSRPVGGGSSTSWSLNRNLFDLPGKKEWGENNPTLLWNVKRE